MESYDNIINFDYTNIEQWKEFVKSEFIPLNNSVLQLINLRKYFRQLDQIEFIELFENNQNIQEIFIGGINIEGKYNPNSLAKLYKDTIGIYINIKDWIAICKEKGIDAISYIECHYNNPNFYKFIKEINKIIENLLKIIGEKPSEISKEDINRFLNNPEILLNDLKEIFPMIVNLSVNCNYRTFFLLNTRNIPRYYIELAYPKIKSEFKELSRFLGLESKSLVESTENNRDYTIWSHKNNGFAELIYNLNRLIWIFFNKDEYNYGEWVNVLSSTFGKIFNIPNLEDDFYNKALLKLKQPIMLSSSILTREIFSKNDSKLFDCKICKKRDSFVTGHWINLVIYDLNFSIKEGNITKLTHKYGYTESWGDEKRRSGRDSGSHKESLRVIDLINNISPLLFLDLITINFNKNLIHIEAKV